MIGVDKRALRRAITAAVLVLAAILVGATLALLWWTHR